MKLDHIISAIGINGFLIKTGNANFTTPDPTLTVVIDIIDNLETKAVIAKDESKQEKSNMKAVRKKWVALLRNLAWYVEKVAGGDENILLSSGFELSKDPKSLTTRCIFCIAGCG